MKVNNLINKFDGVEFHVLVGECFALILKQLLVPIQIPEKNTTRVLMDMFADPIREFRFESETFLSCLEIFYDKKDFYEKDVTKAFLLLLSPELKSLIEMVYSEKTILEGVKKLYECR